MFEIINKHYVMQIARSFWKIDRCLDLDQTMNSSFYYAQKLHAQNQGLSSDWQSNSNMQSHTNLYSDAGDLKSKGKLSVHYGDDLNFKSPDRDMKNIRATSPRAKYGGLKKDDNNTMSKGLLGVMKRR